MLESRSMRTIFTSMLLLFSSILLAGGVYMEPDTFIEQSFASKPPAPKAIWLTKPLKAEIETILQHTYKGLRVRYWREGKRTAWILDEIGKEKPITTGIMIDDGRIEQVRILVFRESRGWEVRHDFFTEQFDDARLEKDNRLSNHIDNISGATLSVRAVSKQARIALLLHRHVIATQD